MSVETFKKIETFKGIEKKNQGLEQIFAELKFNKKKPKYNYHAGLTAGLLVGNLIDFQKVSKTSDDEKVLTFYLEQVMKGAKILVVTYNWNLFDLNQLAFQFFGDEDE